MQHTIYAPQLLFYGLTGFSLLAVLLKALILVGVRPKQLNPRRFALATVSIGYTLHHVSYGLLSEGIGFDFSQPQLQTIDWGVHFLFVILLYGHTFVKRTEHGFVVGGISVAIALILPVTLRFFPTAGLNVSLSTMPIVLASVTIGLCVVAAVRTIGRTDKPSVYYVAVPCVMLPFVVTFRLFPVWSLLWWTSFVLFVILITVVLFRLIQTYRRLVTFNLNHYFALASTITLVVVTMVASILLVRAQIRFMEETINDRATVLVDSLSTRQTLQTSGFTDLMLANLSQPFAHLDGIAVCDHNGTNLFESTTLPESLIGSVDQSLVDQAIAGQVMAVIERTQQPGSGTTYRSVAVAPLDMPSEPSSGLPNVVITAQELPDFADALQQVRLTVLTVATLGMVILFAALMGIVGYGDQLLTRQTKALQKAYDDLQQSEEMREDMMNMIIHDMRQPLSAVQLDLGLIKRHIEKGRSADKTMKSVNRATDSTERALFLINDILDLAKLESGTFHMQSTVAHPADLIADRIQVFVPEAEAEKRLLTWSADPTLPMVEVDDQLFRRVLDNLVSNAIRYTKKQDEISVTAVQDGEFVRFCVSDTGIGIRQEVMDTIFDKFVQVDSDGTVQRQGVGLGLAFCRMAVQAHDGQIGVESTVGEGTTFMFTIPIAPEQAISKPVLVKIQKKPPSHLSSNLL